MSSNWYRLDDQRASWVFLRVGNDNEELDGIQWWEVGIANADQLFQTETARIGCSDTSESSLLDSLLQLLNTLREDEPLLMTPSRSHLYRLRGRLIEAQTDSTASLRSFRYVSVDEQLSRHFDQTLQDYGYGTESNAGPHPPETEFGTLSTSTSLDHLWEIWTATVGLIPVTELEGQQL